MHNPDKPVKITPASGKPDPLAAEWVNAMIPAERPAPVISLEQLMQPASNTALKNEQTRKR